MKIQDKIKMKTKSNKGITLIALVITIIVLLILAGVTLAALEGDNGIVTRAKEAVKKTKTAQEEELKQLDEFEKMLKDIENPKVESNFTNVNAADTNPAGVVPENSTVLEADASKGIVIKDKNNNEWVWIEVPKTTVFTGLTIDTTKTLTEQNYTDIKNKLITYAGVYRKGDATQNENWTDEWYEGCGMTSDEYITAYQKMLKSVYTYGGFWIGRYEAGIEGSITDLTKARTGRGEGGSARVGGTEGAVSISYDGTSAKILKLMTITTQPDKANTLPKAISQKDAIPYNWIYCSEAQALAKEMTPNSKYTSSLMFGIQWDLVCKYLEVKGGLSVADINSNSTSWGNYENAKIENITSGKYAIMDTNTWNLGTWTTISGSYTKPNTSPDYDTLLSTGITDYTKKMNIYDFAGNEGEWTLEKTSSSNPCANRGGIYGLSGSGNPASSRVSNYAPVAYSAVGFRPALYAN